jgi:hypothetical protein
VLERDLSGFRFIIRWMNALKSWLFSYQLCSCYSPSPLKYCSSTFKSDSFEKKGRVWLKYDRNRCGWDSMYITITLKSIREVMFNLFKNASCMESTTLLFYFKRWHRFTLPWTTQKTTLFPYEISNASNCPYWITFKSPKYYAIGGSVNQE